MTQCISFNAAGHSSFTTTDRPNEIFFYHLLVIQKTLLLQRRRTFKQSWQNTGRGKKTNIKFLLCGSNTVVINPDRKYLLLCTPGKFWPSTKAISPSTTFVNNELGISKKRLGKMTAEFAKDVKERKGKRNS